MYKSESSVLTENTYKIEKNIPLPTERTKASKITECLQHMEIGDSVLIEDRLRSSFYQSAYRSYLNPNGTVKISIRNEGEGKTRVWRIK